MFSGIKPKYRIQGFSYVKESELPDSKMFVFIRWLENIHIGIHLSTLSSALLLFGQSFISDVFFFNEDASKCMWMWFLNLSWLFDLYCYVQFMFLQFKNTSHSLTD